MKAEEYLIEKGIPDSNCILNVNNPNHGILISELLTDFAEKEKAELIGLLKIAKCPDCDGSGVIVSGGGYDYVSSEMASDAGMPEIEGSRIEKEPDIEQCQWCYEREIILEQNQKEDDH